MTETTPESTATSPPPHGLTPAQQLALLERIVGSPQLRRAARLREFLLFVGRQSIRNGSAPIHEQEIGAAVFERPTAYDTGIDNIVRVNATELRKRLELYFSADGVDEPVVVEIPRGSYTLLFHARALLPPSPQSQAFEAPVPIADGEPALLQPEPAVPAISSRLNKLWQAIALLLFLVSVTVIWQNLHLREELSPWRKGASLRSFWSEFLDRGQEVDVVLADTSFALAEDIEHRSIPLASYLDYDYKRVDNIDGLSSDRREDIQSALDRNNGSAGDFIVAQRIIALDHAEPSLRVKFAREYSSEAIKVNSVILIGSRQSNPWVELFDSRMNFSIEYDPVRHSSTVQNRKPKPGEEAAYRGLGGISQNEGLSIIAFMPDLSRSGSALIIEGTDSQATRAAGEFVTSDTALASFLTRIGAKNFPYFEILLESSQLTGTPLRSQILAYRTYPRTNNLAANESGHPE
jgi:hypothetical protein